MRTLRINEIRTDSREREGINHESGGERIEIVQADSGDESCWVIRVSYA